MKDLISRNWLIECIEEGWIKFDTQEDENKFIHLVRDAAPPVESETSRIENALHGKSAEEQYDFIWWLLQNYAMNFTDSRQAAIEWLKGDMNETD